MYRPQLNLNSLARLPRAGVLLFVPCSLMLIAGCGNPTGEVNGTVTYKNKALSSGTVTIETADGAKQGTIEADGSYTVKDVLCGENKVIVVCMDDAKMLEWVKKASAGGRDPKGGLTPTPPPPAGGFAIIPQKYNTSATSGLSVNVQRGVTTYNIDLK